MAAEHKARVGGRIRDAREEKGWSQRELASALPGKVDGPSVSRWERGITYPEQYIDHLAAALEKDVSFFLAPEPKDGVGDLMGALADNAQVEDRVERLLEQQSANLERQSEILERLTAAQELIEQRLAAIAPLAEAMAGLARELADLRQELAVRRQAP